jgi:hypothetical protein
LRLAGAVRRSLCPDPDDRPPGGLNARTLLAAPPLRTQVLEYRKVRACAGHQAGGVHAPTRCKRTLCKEDTQGRSGLACWLTRWRVRVVELCLQGRVSRRRHAFWLFCDGQTCLLHAPTC